MSDLQVLQKISCEVFSDLLDITLKFVSTKSRPSDLLEQYKTVSPSNAEISEIESAMQLLLKSCKDAVKRGKPLAQLSDELRKLGMTEDQTGILSKQWEKIASLLLQNAAADTIPINPLLDMEWKFGVTSSSNQLNTAGNVFLQMKLEVDKGNGQTKTACFELQLSEFYAFLHEMERARASLEYLS